MNSRQGYRFSWTRGTSLTVPGLRWRLKELYEKYLEANSRLAKAAEDAHAKRKGLRKGRPKLYDLYQKWHSMWESVKLRDETEFLEEFDDVHDQYLEMKEKCRQLEHEIPLAEALEDWSRAEEEKRWKIYDHAKKDLEWITGQEETGHNDEEEEEGKESVVKVVPPRKPGRASRVDYRPLWRRDAGEPSFDELQVWIDHVNDCFQDYSKMDDFPDPPAWICGRDLCEIQGRKLAACACNIRSLFGRINKGDLNKTKRYWHPRNFERCEEGKREEFVQKAEEVYMVVDSLATMVEDRKREVARNGGDESRRAKRMRRM